MSIGSTKRSRGPRRPPATRRPDWTSRPDPADPASRGPPPWSSHRKDTDDPSSPRTHTDLVPAVRACRSRVDRVPNNGPTPASIPDRPPAPVRTTGSTARVEVDPRFVVASRAEDRRDQPPRWDRQEMQPHRSAGAGFLQDQKRKRMPNSPAPPSNQTDDLDRAVDRRNLEITSRLLRGAGRPYYASG